MTFFCLKIQDCLCAGFWIHTVYICTNWDSFIQSTVCPVIGWSAQLGEWPMTSLKLEYEYRWRNKQDLLPLSWDSMLVQPGSAPASARRMKVTIRLAVSSMWEQSWNTWGQVWRRRESVQTESLSALKEKAAGAQSIDRISKMFGVSVFGADGWVSITFIFQ